MDVHPCVGPHTNMKPRKLFLVASASLCSAQIVPFGPDPPGVPSDFLCEWRNNVLNYSTKIRPDAKQLVYDALAINQYCNGTTNRPSDLETPTIFPPALQTISDDSRTLYVDGTNGADSNPGTADKPFKTIQPAVEASRTFSGNDRKTVVIKEGTYYLTGPLELAPADSSLTIQNQGGDEVWLSGGTLLGGLKWSEYKVSADSNQNIWQADVSSF